MSAPARPLGNRAGAYQQPLDGTKEKPTVRSLIIAILGVTLACPALAHDPLHPVNDQWFEALRVPVDTATLNKGSSCCNQTDCKPRRFRVLGGGLYQMQADDGSWLPFTSAIFITDPEIVNANPHLQFVGCIYKGVPVCAVMPPARG